MVSRTSRAANAEPFRADRPIATTAAIAPVPAAIATTSSGGWFTMAGSPSATDQTTPATMKAVRRNIGLYAATRVSDTRQRASLRPA